MNRFRHPRDGTKRWAGSRLAEVAVDRPCAGEDRALLAKIGTVEVVARDERVEQRLVCRHERGTRQEVEPASREVQLAGDAPLLDNARGRECPEPGVGYPLRCEFR